MITLYYFTLKIYYDLIVIYGDHNFKLFFYFYLVLFYLILFYLLDLVLFQYINCNMQTF